MIIWSTARVESDVSEAAEKAASRPARAIAKVKQALCLICTGHEYHRAWHEGRPYLKCVCGKQTRGF